MHNLCNITCTDNWKDRSIQNTCYIICYTNTQHQYVVETHVVYYIDAYIAGHRNMQTHCITCFLRPSKAAALEQQWEGLSELQEVQILPMPLLSHTTIRTAQGTEDQKQQSCFPESHTAFKLSKCTFRNVESHFNSLLWHTLMLAIRTVGKLLPSISLMFVIFAQIVLLREELGFSIILQGQQRSA